MQSVMISSKTHINSKISFSDISSFAERCNNSALNAANETLQRSCEVLTLVSLGVLHQCTFCGIRASVVFTEVEGKMHVGRLRNATSHGFTLIELLIVVAIIGILASIAIPNFLLSQARAKVARAQSDLQAIATALEMYRLDNSDYPAMSEQGFAGGPPPIQGSELKWWYVPDVLSSPVSYLSKSNILCPFGGNYDKAPFFPDEIWRRYGYENIAEMIAKAQSGWVIFQWRYPAHAIAWSGPWRLQCVGPDKIWNPSVTYDPSNGVISDGDIIRTQKNPTGNVAPGGP